MSHFQGKFKPIVHDGKFGLTFLNPEDNKGIILDGFVLFKGIDGDIKGIAPEDYIQITWKLYCEKLLESFTKDNNSLMLLLLKSIFDKMPNSDIVNGSPHFDEIVKGMSEEYLYDFQKFVIKEYPVKESAESVEDKARRKAYLAGFD